MCMYNMHVCYMFLPILIHSVYYLMRCDKVLLLPIGKIIKIFYMLIINSLPFFLKFPSPYMYMYIAPFITSSSPSLSPSLLFPLPSPEA